MSDVLGFVLEAARGRRWRRRRRKVVRWVVRRVVGLGKGGGGGWLALLICKTANLRTPCLPALLFVLHILHRLLFLRRTYSLFLPFPSYSLLAFRLGLTLSHARVSRPLQTRTPIHIVTLSLSRPVPSLLPAFPHPCGTSRKLYVPTLATLNAGLARDNPQPSPPPSAAYSSPSLPEPSVVLPISATRRQPLFSPLTDSPPGFTTS